jgi:N-acetylneuraminic acid mutarotase
MNKIISLLLVILISCNEPDEKGPEIKNKWTLMKEFPGGPRSRMISFSINGKGYAGMGLWVGDVSTNSNNYIEYKDLWEYTPDTDQWIKMADAPFGTPEAAFTIDNKAYILTFGIGFLEYDPAKNAWTRKANFPFYRSGHRGFALNGKIYVGGGYDNSNTNVMFNDWWEYDPIINKWNAKNPLPFSPRTYCATWATADKGYIGFGQTDGTLIEDIYEYNQSSDAWVKKNSLEAKVINSSSFTIDGKPFLLCISLTGNNESASNLEYNPATDKWSSKSSLQSRFNSEITSFSIGKNAYVVGGFNGSGPNPGSTSQVWKYEY